MKQRVAGLVLVGALAVGPAAGGAAETIDAPSRLTAVTVFADRAAVTREAELKFSKGRHTVRIAPLPGQVEPESITARSRGEARVVLYGIRLAAQPSEAVTDPKVKEIREDIERLTRLQQASRNLKRVLEQERQYFNSIQAASSLQIGKDLATRSPGTEDATALLEFLDEPLLKNFERDQEADAQLEALSRQLEARQRELSDLTQGGSRQEAAILVDLESGESPVVQLEVSYRVFGATWEPSYEARTASGVDEVDLVSSGVVRQQTGEDWNGVQLTLSTAKPPVSGAMPELKPLFIRPSEPRPLQAAGSPAGGAHVETQEPAVTFSLPKPEWIPSDGQPHKVPISATRLPARFAYQTTPRLLADAFLYAKITNTSDAPYLAGPVSVFLDGGFVTGGALKFVAPGETFDLSLGADQRVQVRRKQLKEHVDVSLLPGMRGKVQSADDQHLAMAGSGAVGTVVFNRSETLVENLTGRQITVTVVDQVPVSEREEIVVESVKQVPPDVQRDEEKPGVFRWTFDLIPNQKQELKLSYRIRHPAAMQLSSSANDPDGPPAP